MTIVFGTNLPYTVQSMTKSLAIVEKILMKVIIVTKLSIFVIVLEIS